MYIMSVCVCTIWKDCDTNSEIKFRMKMFPQHSVKTPYTFRHARG